MDAPRPRAPVLRIMALGDSVTEGIDAASAYRTWLADLLRLEGRAFDFVGGLRGFHEGDVAAGVDADHEGHWGWRTDEVAAHLEGWLAEARPDVVLVHLGHNDLGSGEAPEEVAREVAVLARSIRASDTAPTVLVALAIGSEIAGLDAVLAAMNDALAAEIEALGDPELRTVDLATGFEPAAMTADGIHPNEAGARFMAQRWLEALQAVRPGSVK